MVRLLLFDPEGRPEPNVSQVFWTWATCLPVAALCFYLAWGYAASGHGGVLTWGFEAFLVLGGIGTMIRPVNSTRRWLGKTTGE